MNFMSEFVKQWSHAPHPLRRAIKDFEKNPSERNECFLIGYLTALNDNHLIAEEVYRFFMMLSAKMKIQSMTRDVVRRAMT